ncbi:hypothetical protein B0H19DRAFT_1139020 [Mycena capillaripes]|nr:hypothetical protein B0H19DRAFT_1139020 [Mycena capillaripes]
MAVLGERWIETGRLFPLTNSASWLGLLSGVPAVLSHFVNKVVFRRPERCSALELLGTTS